MEHTLRLRKGAWTFEEDDHLRRCIGTYGEGQWHRIPFRAGLNRCRKSCRLRWLNYLKPDIKRGDFSVDEIDLIMRLHKLLGNRWSLIAGRLPGRTANDVKNYWNTHLKKLIPPKEIIRPNITRNNIIKPRPRTFYNKYFYRSNDQKAIQIGDITTNRGTNSSIFTFPSEFADDNNENSLWWKTLIGDEMKESNNNGATEESATQKIECNMGDNINNLYFDDVNFWDFLDAPQDLSI